MPIRHGRADDQKDLLMLLPYYLMRYEDDCKKAGRMKNREKADRRMAVFMEACEDLIEKLSDRCSAKKQQYMFQTLADLIIDCPMRRGFQYLDNCILSIWRMKSRGNGIFWKVIGNF